MVVCFRGTVTPRHNYMGVTSPWKLALSIIMVAHDTRVYCHLVARSILHLPGACIASLMYSKSAVRSIVLGGQPLK
jgi:hypothetical protein